MTVTTFKKKEPNDFIAKGLVVCLNSDVNEEFPMTTTGEVKNGQVLCRWYDTVGCLQGDWFYPAELYLQDTAEDELEIDFNAEFDTDEAK